MYDMDARIITSQLASGRNFGNLPEGAYQYCTVYRSSRTEYRRQESPSGDNPVNELKQNHVRKDCTVYDKFPEHCSIRQLLQIGRDLCNCGLGTPVWPPLHLFTTYLSKHNATAKDTVGGLEFAENL